jgi:hypothetical protein
VCRRSRESLRTDGGVPAPSSALSKQVAKQSWEVGTVRLQTADLEPREGAPTAKARKGRRETAAETRPTALTSCESGQKPKRRRFLPGLKSGVSAPSIL